MEKINYKDYPISQNGFDYCEKHYDCNKAIERDIKMIIQEAETSHKDNFDEFFDRSTLKPSKARVFVNENGTPIVVMILYVIYQRKDGYWRSACGGYYPLFGEELSPHPYQESICW
jgi:hypothetical protein